MPPEVQRLARGPESGVKFPKPVKRDKIPKRLGRRRRSRAGNAARASRGRTR